MKRCIKLRVACAIIGAGILLVRGAPTPAQQPSDENHFRCYIVSQQTPQPASTITLEDQFTASPQTVSVGEAVMICAPTAKTVDGEVFPIEDEQEHFTLYTAPGVASPRSVLVTDQFGANVAWQVTTPKYVMVPTAKTVDGATFDDRTNLNHYWCYEANGPRVGVRATLEDQFSGPDAVRITTPTLWCNPAEKVHANETFEIEDEDLHLACYEIHGKQKTEQFTVGVANQFEEDEFQTAAWEILCAPAEKTLPDAAVDLAAYMGWPSAFRLGWSLLKPMARLWERSTAEMHRAYHRWGALLIQAPHLPHDLLPIASARSSAVLLRTDDAPCSTGMVSRSLPSPPTACPQPDRARVAFMMDRPS